MIYTEYKPHTLLAPYIECYVTAFLSSYSDQVLTNMLKLRDVLSESQPTMLQCFPFRRKEHPPCFGV